MKVLLREDFKHVVELLCPHDGIAVRGWMSDNHIPFVFYSVDRPGQHWMAYAMTEIDHAALFALRWAA